MAQNLGSGFRSYYPLRVSNILTKLGWRKSGRERIAGKQVMMWQKQDINQKGIVSIATNIETPTTSNLQDDYTYNHQNEQGIDTNVETPTTSNLQDDYTYNHQNEQGIDSINKHMAIPQSEVLPEVLPPSNLDTASSTENVTIPVYTSTQNPKLSKNVKDKTKKFWVKVW